MAVNRQVAATPTDGDHLRRVPDRILIGKVGLDGHDRGAKYVAHIFRDAGYEVIYTGIRRTPKQIVEAALQEDVALIGLSLLSGAHKTLLQEVMDLLRERGALDILVVVGGTIPSSDQAFLQGIGIAHIFTPGASSQAIRETVASLLKSRDPQHEG
jgi:methylmalonyl-CoA mutase, C-terminal domain